MRVGPYVRLLRPVNSVMVGLAVLVGAYLAEPNPSLWDVWGTALGFVTGFTLTGFSMVLNDYFDRDIDAVNEPSRPIPSGAVKPSEALVYASLLSVVGLTTSMLTGTGCLMLAALSTVLSIGYTSYGKRLGLVGNMMVSGCIAIPFLYGGLLVGTPRLSNLLAASTAFLSNTGREVTKGIVDLEGDRRFGVETVAVRYGCRRAAYVAAALYTSAVLLTPIPFFTGDATLGYLIAVAVTDLGFLYSSIRLLKDPSRGGARRVKNQVVVWMLLGLLAFTLLEF